MILLSLKDEYSLGEGVIKADFVDTSSLFFSTEYLTDESFLEKYRDFASGWELSQDEEESILFAGACYQAEKSALRLIARAEQNSLGLTAKLERRGYDSAVVRAVVSRFLDRNLLDDQRYAESWSRSRLSLKKAISPQRLLAGLRQRGIDRNSAGKALDHVLDPETEYALLLKYIDKSLRGKKALHLRAQLKYEGFSSETLDSFFNQG